MIAHNPPTGNDPPKDDSCPTRGGRTSFRGAKDDNGRRRGDVHPAVKYIGGAMVLLAGLIALAVWKPTVRGEKTLIVYCAAALEPAVKTIAEQYQTELGVAVEIRASSSGWLAAQIAASEQGDLYLPADDSFLNTAHDNGFVAERIPLAQMHLVLGVKSGNPRNIQTLDDLLRKDITYGFANVNAAVGKVTQDVLTNQSKWDEIEAHSKVTHITVTESAMAVQAGNLDAAFVWDTVARQFQLEAVRLPELSSGVGRVSVGVLKTTKQPAAALRFARFLAAADRGQKTFEKAGYTLVPGDVWEVEPTITFFSGGIQRLAMKETIREFEEREGCRINVVYEGCGVLLGMMRGENARRPDAYFACDRSFLSPDDIQPYFLPGRELTETRMVMLVHKGNPRKIKQLTDLAQPDLKVGVAHETNSALGALTKNLLISRYLYGAVRENVRSDGAAKADLLVTQILAGGDEALDVVIVYEANTSQVHETLDVIPIDGPEAIAIQPLAIGKESSHQQLLERLCETLTSKASQTRFEKVGFRWRAAALSKPETTGGREKP